MRLSILAGAVVCALLPNAAAWAETKAYAILGDFSTLVPGDGTIMHPASNTGTMILDDDGAGTVTLDEFFVRNQFTDIVGGTSTTQIPGATVILDNDTTIYIDTGQTGSGSIRSEVSWGALTNWTSSGELFCATRCPGGGCGPASACLIFVGFDGTGPPPPFKSSEFNSDPWVFDEFGNHEAIGKRCVGGSARNPDPTDPNDIWVCTQNSDCPGTCSTGKNDPTFPCTCSDTLEVLFLEPIPGQIARANIEWRSNPVPAVPLLGVAGLAAALLYLGVRTVRRKDR